MTNVIKFPHNQENEKPQDTQAAKATERRSASTLSNILHGLIGVVYIVLVFLWIPVRFILIANVVLQFFKMFFKWDQGAFSAAYPFVLSFILLAALTYIMATWKPKAP
jgi:hypothetical protein